MKIREAYPPSPMAQIQALEFQARAHGGNLTPQDAAKLKALKRRLAVELQTPPGLRGLRFDRNGGGGAA